MTETTWFWIGLAGMTFGALALSLLGGRRTQDEEAHTIIHGIVPLVAACSYLAMALNQGGQALPDGHIFWYARYIDWTITTPLLLLGLAVTALHGAHRRPGLVAALLGADALMIATGLFSGLSSDPTHRWVWFLVSCGAFVAVSVVLFGPLRREARARDHERAAAYTRHVAVLAGLWLLYPVVVGLGPDGAGTWSAVTATGAIAVLDLLAKVGYGALSVLDARRISHSDLERHEVTAVAVTTHAVPTDAGQSAVRTP